MAAMLVFLVIVDTFLSGLLLAYVWNMRGVVAHLAEIQQSHDYDLSRLVNRAGGDDA